MFHQRPSYDQRMYFSHPAYGFNHPLPINFHRGHGSMNRILPPQSIRNNGFLGFNVRVEDEVAIIDAVGGRMRRRLETAVLDDGDVGGRQGMNNLNLGFSVVDGILMLDESVLIDGGSGDNRVEQDKKFLAEKIWQYLGCRIFHTTGDQDSGFCVVCQSEFLDAEKLGKLDCGHEFHADCIHQWLLEKNVCPMCKRTALAELETPKMAKSLFVPPAFVRVGKRRQTFEEEQKIYKHSALTLEPPQS